MLVVLFIAALSFGSGNSARDEYRENVFDIAKGINLNEWLEKTTLDSTRLNYRVTHEDIDSIVSMGFDHVRFPISEEHFFDETLNEKWEQFDVLLDRVNYCISKGLKVIIDLHVTRTHQFYEEKNILFASDSAKKEFMSVWKKLQNIFSKYPESVLAYECLNEPAASPKGHDKWNQLLNEWISLIRQKEKDRILFVGSNQGNQIWTLKYLKLPEDPKMVYTFHFYAPFFLTHYRVEKQGKFLHGEIPNYPGKIISAETYSTFSDSLKKRYSYTQEVHDSLRIQKDFYEVFEWAKKRKIQVNLGEFGCLRYVSDEARLSWLHDVVNAAKQHGFSYTLWGLNGSGFGLEINKQKIDYPMRDVIVE